MATTLTVLLALSVALGNGAVFLMILLRIFEERRDAADCTRTAAIQRSRDGSGCNPN